MSEHNAGHANLKPNHGGEVRNPKGVNQYTYREDAERDLAAWCKEYGHELIDRLLNDARKGKTKMMELALARILPAITKHEIAVPGTDAAGLAAFMSERTTPGRANGHDREDEHPGANGSSGVAP